MRTADRWIPGRSLLADREHHGVARDVGAGIVLTGLLIPAGMGYAQAAGLQPVYGLYASVVPLIAYALVGPSRVLVLGPDSALAPLIATTVLPLAAGDPRRAAALASGLALVAGLMCIVGAVARLGFLSDLLSLPIRYGYMNGIALSVAVSQLPRLLGIPIEGGGVLAVATDVARAVVHGNIHAFSTVVGTVCLGALLLLRRYSPRAPAMLLAMVGASAAVAIFNLGGHGVALVGDIPRGLPVPAWPAVHWSDISDLSSAAFGIAVVSFADTSVLSRLFASRRGDDAEPNRELFALGFANVASGLFGGFAVSASASRTPVAVSAGARTQRTGVVAALVILIVLVAAPALSRDLPTAALAAVVIAAAVALVELRALAHLARARPSELALSGITFVAVIILGPTRGVVVAVVVSLVRFLAKAWRPHTTTLVRVAGMKGYHDNDRHPEGESIPGLVLYRFDAPLFFANAQVFRDEVLQLARPGSGVRRLVITAEPITDIDASSADMLERLHSDLTASGVTLAFAGLKGHVREQLGRYGVVERIGPDLFHPTVGEAVRRYVSDEHVDWVDWEDGPPHTPPRPSDGSRPTDGPPNDGPPADGPANAANDA